MQMSEAHWKRLMRFVWIIADENLDVKILNIYLFGIR